MRKVLLLISFLCLAACLSANTIGIPLKMSVFQYVAMDNPTGSTPDPTDPNQFRVELTGNMLTIHTQDGQVAYVIVAEDKSEAKGEDYFFGISTGQLSCYITGVGHYTIRIGYWKTDFTGEIYVYSAYILDLQGHLVSGNLGSFDSLPSGDFIVYLETSLGGTSSKIRIRR